MFYYNIIRAFRLFLFVAIFRVCEIFFLSVFVLLLRAIAGCPNKKGNVRHTELSRKYRCIENTKKRAEYVRVNLKRSDTIKTVYELLFSPLPISNKKKGPFC